MEYKAETTPISMGPAPSSGDGEAEGPEWGEDFINPGIDVGPGPAPNAGDGIPDGSGF